MGSDVRRTRVRRSSIHGRGLFAGRHLAAGEDVIEYRGHVVTWEEATRDWSPEEPGHTMLFDVGDGLVIDGTRGGNSARWLNHSCEPNCEAIVVGRRVVITTIYDVPAGTELLLDYKLELDSADRALALTEYACACGAESCRSTMARL
jgi:uncharacterized protein